MSMTTNIAQDIFSFEGAFQWFVHLKFYVKLKKRIFKKSYKIKTHQMRISQCMDA